MKKTLTTAIALALCTAALAAEDLKGYYEAQKTALRSQFSPPQLGSQVTFRLASGQSRTGILMKLSPDSLSLMSETGNATFQRMALHESSRTVFFAEDFAHVSALEKTREYRNKQRAASLAEEQANIHDGRISVSAKTTKTNEKDEKVEEKENQRTGEKRKHSTITRTYSETQHLKIAVFNSTAHPDSFTLEWYFFSKNVSKGGTEKERENDKKDDTPKLQNSAKKQVTLEGLTQLEIEMNSSPFVMTRIEKYTGGNTGRNEPRTTGEENAGWLVLLKYNGEILDKKASAKSYLGDDWIQQLPSPR
ncbi:hypothetical protein P4E94_01045 [Pontiellaceae bacterium B12219]|nr:hypothetical protein [Pontiellaceae bacterium B12219]